MPRMTIPLVDLKEQSALLKPSITKTINEVIDKSDFILGEYVENFENSFAKYLSIKYCFGVASGTDAMYLCLRALDITTNDEVIVPAMTFTASISPIIITKAKPVFVDILPDSPLIDYSKIEKAITAKTKAIVAVHLNGMMCDIDKIRNIAQKYGIPVIEDACQAHGSKYKKRKAGSFGMIAAFSFYPGKNLGAFGDAGAVVTSDRKLALKVKMLRNHGQKKKYHHELLGINSRLDTLQAAILMEKLKYLDTWNKKRNKLASLYRSLLSGLPIHIVWPDEHTVSNFHLFAIQTKKRNHLLTYLKENGVSTGIHYPYPIHLQKPFQYLQYKKHDFPNAEKYAKESLSLPMYPELKEEQVEYISNLIHRYFNTTL